MSRYTTLKNSNLDLTKRMNSLEKELENLKTKVANYEKTTKTEIMQLNNEIGQLQQQFEKIEDQKNKLKSEAEETSSKKLSKISDLARILMAINNIEVKCYNRKENSRLKYAMTGLDDPKNFNNFKLRSVYAMEQLKLIEQYLTDFQKIVENVYTENPDIKLKIKEKKDNNEII